MNKVYEKVKEFDRKYPGTIKWRIKAHSKVVEQHLMDDENIIFAFAAQSNQKFSDIFDTSVVALTSKRIVIGQKRVVFGYRFDFITPEMFNDLKIYSGLIWGVVTIDTIKEVMYFSNIAKRAMPEIENTISKCMMEEKKKYGIREKIDPKYF